MSKPKTILVSPLNWGLGHSSRLVPIIRYLKKSGHNVIIGGDGISIKLLKDFFPDLEYIYISSPPLIYGKKKAISLRFYLSFLGFITNVFREHSQLKKIVRKYDIDLIISDNRLGLYSKKVRSVYISHQLNIYIKAGQVKKSGIATFANQWYIKKFDICLIPDIGPEDKSLTGRLIQDHKKLNTFFIGPVSRFETKSYFNHSAIEYDFICILSGPEPQRTIFEKKLIKIFLNYKYKVIIVRGLPHSSETKQDFKGICFRNHADDKELMDYINRSRRIICRSGYSTIMDLAYIGRRAIIVPTPEQPEQEYIATRLQDHHGFVKIDQNRLESVNLRSLEYEEEWQFPDNKESFEKIIDRYLY